METKETKKELKARKIDICICVKNNLPVIESLFSLIDKMIANLDCNIILVDGNSTDGSIINIIDFYYRHESTCRFRQIKQDNSSYIEAYNVALANTKSEYICWMDSDDLCDEKRLKVLSEYLDTHEDVDVVSCSTYLPNKRAITNTLVNANNEQISNALANGINMKELCHFQSCMFRRSCLNKFKNDKYFYPEFIGGYAGEGFLYLLHFNGYKFANTVDTYYVYTKGMVPTSLTNTLQPLYDEELSKMSYDEKKKELMKLFRKYNKKEINAEK